MEMKDIVRSKIPNFPYHLEEGKDFYLTIFERHPLIYWISPSLAEPDCTYKCDLTERDRRVQLMKNAEKWRAEHHDFIEWYRAGLSVGDFGR